MAIDSYTTLQDAVVGWLHRDDLADQVPDFIALAEARLARNLRHQRMLTTATLTTVADDPAVALPTDWLEFRRLRLTSPDRVLDPISGSEFTQFPAAYGSSPRHYVVEGSNLVLAPVPDGVYTIEATYYARIAALADTPTNWLLTAHPGLYLYGALVEAAPFTRDDPTVWDAKFLAELTAAQDADTRARTSGSTLRVRSR